MCGVCVPMFDVTVPLFRAAGPRSDELCRLITCLVPPGSTWSEKGEKGEATREARGAQQVDNLLARALHFHFRRASPVKMSFARGVGATRAKR